MSEEDGLISEVPAHIRHQSAPAPTHPPTDPAPPPDPAPPAPAPPQERTRVRAAHTNDRAGRALTGAAAQPSALRQPTGATVAAVRCPAGHFTPPAAPLCRTCGAPVSAEQQPLRVPRPPLGTLLLADGQAVLLERGAVLGRKPQPLPGGEPWPHLVELPSELTHLSRNHLLVELDGWHVVARDLGSSAGTTLRSPGRPPLRLRPHDAQVLEPGAVLDLAGDFSVTFVVATG